MKTAISIPDAIFKKAERLARRLRKSRSQLYSEAVREYVRRHDPDSVTAQVNEVCGKLEVLPDAFVGAASRRILERSEW